MNLSSFLEHWKLTENPFRAEEARQDPVFTRLESASRDGPQAGARGEHAATPNSDPLPRPASTAAQVSATAHSDFEKIAGDFECPSTAIVFGEKGSGKTAIRIQLADRVRAHNRAHPDRRCLLIAYDDLNPVLGRFLERVGIDKKSSIADALAKFRLVDHIDAILATIVPRIVGRVLSPRGGDPTMDDGAGPDLGDDPRKAVRKWSRSLRQDLLVLQVVYDGAMGTGGDAAGAAAGIAGSGGGAGIERRTRRLRYALRLRLPLSYLVWTLLSLTGWIAPAAVAYYAWSRGVLTFDPASLARLDNVVWIIGGLAALYLLILLKRSVWDRLRYITSGHRIRRQVRTSTRSDASYGRSLAQLETSLLDPSVLPMTNSDDVRYAMLERLRRVLAAFGYASGVIVIDRVDEPTQISGDPDRMRAVVWPLLNNKFLQQRWLGVKLLLPMELRHALFRESAAFFQEARLDKQNLIERLAWTGAMLYDLCTARLQACRAAGEPPIGLLDLFAEDVTRQDLIDALDQMHQPRDAFKMLYQCFSEHAASQTSEQPAFRVPKLILEMVRKSQVERVRQLYRGVRPA